jgi:hypothetical protein
MLGPCFVYRDAFALAKEASRLYLNSLSCTANDQSLCLTQYDR